MRDTRNTEVRIKCHVIRLTSFRIEMQRCLGPLPMEDTQLVIIATTRGGGVRFRFGEIGEYGENGKNEG